LLAHCLARAIIASAGGLEAATERWGPSAERMKKIQGLRLAMKLTPKASRVAAFVVMWAIAMREEGRDEYSITEYQRYWNEGERKAYRIQADFRELWPEFDTPNELARQVVKYFEEHRVDKGNPGSLPLAVPVLA
jgi:hypothetical protein